MEAPVKREGQWVYPDREWLFIEYIVLQKSARQIGKEQRATNRSVQKWLNVLEIPQRTQAEANRVAAEKRIVEKTKNGREA